MNDKQLKILKKNNEESREFTRNCISAALVVLLNKNERMDNITITRLCQVAGVSRVAFYRNYRSIDEVLTDKIDAFAHKLASQIETDIYNNWLMIFKEVEKDRQNFEILLRLGLEHKILEVFMSLLPKNEENRTVQAIWLSIFYSLIIKWIKDKKPKKIEDAARIAYKYTKDIPLVEKTKE